MFKLSLLISVLSVAILDCQANLIGENGKSSMSSSMVREMGNKMVRSVEENDLEETAAGRMGRRMGRSVSNDDLEETASGRMGRRMGRSLNGGVIPANYNNAGGRRRWGRSVYGESEPVTSELKNHQNLIERFVRSIDYQLRVKRALEELFDAGKKTELEGEVLNSSRVKRGTVREKIANKAADYMEQGATAAGMGSQLAATAAQMGINEMANVASEVAAEAGTRFADGAGKVGSTMADMMRNG